MSVGSMFLNNVNVNYRTISPVLCEEYDSQTGLNKKVNVYFEGQFKYRTVNTSTLRKSGFVGTGDMLFKDQLESALNSQLVSAVQYALIKVITDGQNYKDIISNSQKIKNDVLKSVNTNWKDFYGIELQDVTFENIISEEVKINSEEISQINDIKALDTEENVITDGMMNLVPEETETNFALGKEDNANQYFNSLVNNPLNQQQSFQNDM